MLVRIQPSPIKMEVIVKLTKKELIERVKILLKQRDKLWEDNKKLKEKFA